MATVNVTNKSQFFEALKNINVDRIVLYNNIQIDEDFPYYPARRFKIESHNGNEYSLSKSPLISSLNFHVTNKTDLIIEGVIFDSISFTIDEYGRLKLKKFILQNVYYTAISNSGTLKIKDADFLNNSLDILNRGVVKIGRRVGLNNGFKYNSESSALKICGNLSRRSVIRIADSSYLSGVFSGKRVVVATAENGREIARSDVHDFILPTRYDQFSLSISRDETELILRRKSVLQDDFWVTFRANAFYEPVYNMPRNFRVDSGADCKIPKKIPVCDGLIFIGWNSSPTGRGAAFYPGEQIENVDRNLVLYAQWVDSCRNPFDFFGNNWRWNCGLFGPKNCKYS